MKKLNKIGTTILTVLAPAAALGVTAGAIVASMPKQTTEKEFDVLNGTFDTTLPRLPYQGHEIDTYDAAQYYATEEEQIQNRIANDIYFTLAVNKTYYSNLFSIYKVVVEDSFLTYEDYQARATFTYKVKAQYKNSSELIEIEAKYKDVPIRFDATFITIEGKDVCVPYWNFGIYETGGESDWHPLYWDKQWTIEYTYNSKTVVMNQANVYEERFANNLAYDLLIDNFSVTCWYLTLNEVGPSSLSMQIREIFGYNQQNINSSSKVSTKLYFHTENWSEEWIYEGTVSNVKITFNSDYEVRKKCTSSESDIITIDYDQTQHDLSKNDPTITCNLDFTFKINGNNFSNHDWVYVRIPYTLDYDATKEGITTSKSRTKDIYFYYRFESTAPTI